MKMRLLHSSALVSFLFCIYGKQTLVHGYLRRARGQNTGTRYQTADANHHRQLEQKGKGKAHGHAANTIDKDTIYAVDEVGQPLSVVQNKEYFDFNDPTAWDGTNESGSIAADSDQEDGVDVEEDEVSKSSDDAEENLAEGEVGMEEKVVGTEESEEAESDDQDREDDSDLIANTGLYTIPAESNAQLEARITGVEIQMDTLMSLAENVTKLELQLESALLTIASQEKSINALARALYGSTSEEYEPPLHISGLKANLEP